MFFVQKSSVILASCSDILVLLIILLLISVSFLTNVIIYENLISEGEVFIQSS